MDTVYKIIDRDEWDAARACGRYGGSQDDRRDGFIHLSTAGQMRETAQRHFAGADNLLLLAVSTAVLGDKLKWETSRAGALFPHVYGPLAVASVRRVWPLPVGEDGLHQFPEDAQ